MKILYITNYKKIQASSGGFINDYMNDLLFYGLYELNDIEVVDSTKIIHMYKENKEIIPKNYLWGYGFTSTFLIDNDIVDRTDIEQKIYDKYYDLIIYGACNRCMDWYDAVSIAYPSNKIFLIDGDDSNSIHHLSTKHPYFKRELNSNNYIPIHFAIPEAKITDKKLDKSQEYAKIIPYSSGYLFEKEVDYYEDYNKSYYGVTMKKAGWDCMRHYEILANNCAPYFSDIEDCPKYTLTNLPKKLLIDVKSLTNNFEESKYFDILDELFNYTKQHLTTKELAKYVLSYV